ncbi:MAG: ABC transporter ATP-binding protein [Bacteroidota bacterium]
MNILSLRNVVKRYSNHTAVDHVTFDIPSGSIFGFLGPNGAGKTSLIRIITTITAADEGEILVNGEPLSTHHPTQIGYLPEERGLYKKMKVGDHLMYLAQLKGLKGPEAKKKIDHWLEKFEITEWWNKKVEELSKGMQQKVQFIATVVHDPKLIILDEPFSGLDPINTNLIKDEIYNMNARGTSVIFSTHRMEQVEEICQQIMLINKGKIVLTGAVDDIKRDHKQNLFEVEYTGTLQDNFTSDTWESVDHKEGRLRVQLKPESTPNDLLKGLLEQGVTISSYNEILPTINEIFIQKVGESNE